MLMSSDGGLNGSGNWVEAGRTFIEWDVTRSRDGTWQYSYHLGHPRGKTSHLVLEASRSFGAADIMNARGDFRSVKIGRQRVRSGNP